MSELKDYMSMTPKSFWALVTKEHEAAQERVDKVWAKVGETAITQEEAVQCLNDLFICSHHRIRTANKGMAKYFPTVQHNKNVLKKVKDLWWTDHFTAGVSALSTLNWFSSKKVKKKSGKMGYPGASTHFIMPHHGQPYYIIPLMHKSWHEPRRNNDSLSIEFVNAGKLVQHDGEWCYWPKKYTQPLPENMVQVLPPVRLDVPFRGAEVMQPFTRDQLINAIKLKRIVIAALPGRLAPERMTQHQEWRSGKTDMGPLFLYEEINDAAFDGIPIEEMPEILRYEAELDEVGEILDIEDESENPEIGFDTPTHDHDEPNPNNVMSITEVQEHLVKLNLNPGKIDGKFGPATKDAVKRFQQRWNIQHPDNELTVDGKPGPQTCACLRKALAGA
jgi:N-acetyl-anhydromuramyl-L-alanine amidase AmpD